MRRSIPVLWCLLAVLSAFPGTVCFSGEDGLRDPERLFREEVYKHLKNLKAKLDTRSVKAWVGVQEVGSRAASAIRAALDSDDENIRGQAMFYLGRITNRNYKSAGFWKKWMDEQSPRPMEDLLKECRDTENAQKVEMATAALALFYTEKAPAKLVELVSAEKWKRGDRLAIFGVHALDPVVRRLKKERDADVRVLLTKHLGKLYDPRALDVIEIGMADHSEKVREQAVSELQHLALYNPAVAEDAVRLLVKMLGDPNVTVVLGARRAMELKSVRPIVSRLAGRYASVKTNDAFALIMLGRMYEHGVGMSKDRRKALKCFDTARKLGDSEARKEYNRLRLLVDR